MLRPDHEDLWPPKDLLNRHSDPHIHRSPLLLSCGASAPPPLETPATLGREGRHPGRVRHHSNGQPGVPMPSPAISLIFFIPYGGYVHASDEARALHSPVPRAQKR